MREQHRDRFGVLLRTIAERERAARRQQLKRAGLAAAILIGMFAVFYFASQLIRG